MTSTSSKDRLRALDGLRGIAILMVLIYHYFGRWTPSHGEGLVPYGDTFSDLLIANDGFVGVYLFFLISGFVIFRSLKQSRSFLFFAVKRADRLFLPMIAISLLTFVLLAAPLKTQFMDVRASDLLPSWTFTPPGIWKWIDPEVSYVDGVYWTLFIEVRFYALMAALWFLMPKQFSAPGIVFIALAAVASSEIPWKIETAGKMLDLLLFPNHIALFAAGVVYSDIREEGSRRWHVASLFLLIPVSVWALRDAPEMVASHFAVSMWIVAFHLVFIALSLRKRWAEIFAFTPLVFVGTISYSLYLLHQRLGVAIISRMPPGLGLEVYLVGVGLVVGGMLSLAYLSWRLLETRKPFSGFLPSTEKA